LFNSRPNFVDKPFHSHSYLRVPVIDVILSLSFLSFFSFSQGAHVTINARSSDDVEESIVLEKVKKASGIYM